MPIYGMSCDIPTNILCPPDFSPSEFLVSTIYYHLNAMTQDFTSILSWAGMTELSLLTSNGRAHSFTVYGTWNFVSIFSSCLDFGHVGVHITTSTARAALDGKNRFLAEPCLRRKGLTMVGGGFFSMYSTVQIDHLSIAGERHFPEPILRQKPVRGCLGRFEPLKPPCSTCSLRGSIVTTRH